MYSAILPCSAVHQRVQEGHRGAWPGAAGLFRALLGCGMGALVAALAIYLAAVVVACCVYCAFCSSDGILHQPPWQAHPTRLCSRPFISLQGPGSEPLWTAVHSLGQALHKRQLPLMKPKQIGTMFNNMTRSVNAFVQFAASLLCMLQYIQ